MVDAEYVSTASEIDDAKAHSGILRAAVYVASTIADRHLLDIAFQKAPVGLLLLRPAVSAVLLLSTAEYNHVAWHSDISELCIGPI